VVVVLLHMEGTILMRQVVPTQFLAQLLQLVVAVLEVIITLAIAVVLVVVVLV
jgi:hypothetical protein